MDEPARKRRKTSSPLERASSPLRKPPRRPSFASPTKASLARNYPNLLSSRPTSAGSPIRPNSRGDILARGKQARTYVLSETDTQEESSQDVFQEETSEKIAGAQQRAPYVGSATPRARKGTGQRRAGTPTGGLEDDEPDLPTTPSQRGLEEQDGPRRGVLFSSPSKRPPRAKGPVKQSPLRPKAPPAQRTAPELQVVDGQDAGAQDTAEKREPPDPELERRKHEKARLQREMEELEAQVSRCTEEIVKEQNRDGIQPLLSYERSDLSEFILKVSGADTKVEETTPISSLLCSFLPFSTTIQSRPRTSKDKPIPSHRPIELANPIPYLEMFTSFEISTQLSLPRGKVFPSSNRVHQKHVIDIVGPQKLLTVQISVVIDALANEIIDMHILRLSPWAERELGTLLRAKGKENDIGNACWAIESYWQIAKKRAQYWRRCETEFAHLRIGQTSDDTENIRPQAKETRIVPRKDLYRHLGRDTLILQDKFVILKLNWRIAFDWTGEAESDVSVETAFPNVWTEADTAKTFKRVPETFTSLLHTRGVFEATRVMAALLFAQ
jgi:hypothetical protein